MVKTPLRFDSQFHQQHRERQSEPSKFQNWKETLVWTPNVILLLIYP